MTQSTVVDRGWTNSEPYYYHIMRSHGTHKTGQIQTQLSLKIPVQYKQMELKEILCEHSLNIIKSSLQDKYI
jgi:hypothetical protein